MDLERIKASYAAVKAWEVYRGDTMDMVAEFNNMADARAFAVSKHYKQGFPKRKAKVKYVYRAKR